MSKDFVGNELEIGDNVVVVEPYYRNLVTAVVVKVTPKGASVTYSSKLYGKFKITNRSSDCIMKVVK